MNNLPLRNPPMEIRLHPRKIVFFLSSVTGVLLLLHFLSYVPVFLGWREIPSLLLNFDVEGNLPTLFSTFLLGLNAVFVALIAYSAQRRGKPAWRWWFLALLFFGVGVDESVELHERIGDLVQVMFDTHGVFLFAWVLPYAVLLVALAVIYQPFILRLPPETRRGILIAGVLYVGGGFGIEMPESFWYDTYGEDGIYHLLITAEELLEMIGCLVFIHAFANHLDRHEPELCIRISSSTSS